MVIAGLAALALFTVLLGAFWPSRAQWPIGASAWGLVVKSLTLAWFAFLASFFSPLGSFAPYLVVAGALAAAIWIVLRASPQAAIELPAQVSITTRTSIAIVAVLILVLPGLKALGTTFIEWDAVVSWNRWARELAENGYAPQSAAYPILWPALWSLIYEAQGTSAHWFLAKASLLAPPAAAALYIGQKIAQGPVAPWVILALIAFHTCFGSELLYSGYMDQIAHLFGLLSLLFMIEALQRWRADEAFHDAVLIATLSAGLALMTKQSGAFFAAFAVVFLAIATICRKISVRRAALPLLAPALMVASFAYIYLSRQPSLVGNLDYLVSLAEQTREGENPYLHAWSILSETAPSYVLWLLGAGAVLNIAFVRSRLGVFGAACLVAGLAGFAVFADCCSYGARNGVWIFAFASASALVGYLGLSRWAAVRFAARARAVTRALDLVLLRAPGARGAGAALAPRIVAVGGVVAALAAAGAFAGLAPQSRLLALHEQVLRDSLLGPVAPAVLEKSDAVGERDIVLSNVQLLSWYPGWADKYRYCRIIDASCIASLFDSIEDERVLVFTTPWLQRDPDMSYLMGKVEDGAAVLLGADSGYYLFDVARPTR